MKATREVKQQLQRLGISDAALNLLYQYGAVVQDPDGARRIVFDSAARREVRADVGKKAAQLKFGIYAIVDVKKSDLVIGAGHMHAHV
jgi:hypothetical protein